MLACASFSFAFVLCERPNSRLIRCRMGGSDCFDFLVSICPIPRPKGVAPDLADFSLLGGSTSRPVPERVFCRF